MGRVIAKPIGNFILSYFKQTLQKHTSGSTWANYVSFLEELDNNQAEKNDFFDNIPLNTLSNVQEEYNDVIFKKNELKKIIRHRFIADHQRMAYYAMKRNVDWFEDKVLIDLDFKQQITLGVGPIQISNEYRVLTEDKKMVNCLSFGIHFRDKFINKNNQEEYFVNCLNVDVISDFKDTKAVTVKKYFDYVIQQFPTYFNKSYIVIWSDCGKFLFLILQMICFLIYYENILKEQIFATNFLFIIV
jgi:hypothetical protein